MTNQFEAEVSISFPLGVQGQNVLHWFNFQNCGRATIPLSKKVSAKHKDRAHRLQVSRRFRFVFEVDAEGEWKFVGRRD